MKNIYCVFGEIKNSTPLTYCQITKFQTLDEAIESADAIAKLQRRSVKIVIQGSKEQNRLNEEWVNYSEEV